MMMWMHAIPQNKEKISSATRLIYSVFSHRIKRIKNLHDTVDRRNDRWSQVTSSERNRRSAIKKRIRLLRCIIWTAIIAIHPRPYPFLLLLRFLLITIYMRYRRDFFTTVAESMQGRESFTIKRANRIEWGESESSRRAVKSAKASWRRMTSNLPSDKLSYLYFPSSRREGKGKKKGKPDLKFFRAKLRASDKFFSPSIKSTDYTEEKFLSWKYLYFFFVTYKS